LSSAGEPTGDSAPILVGGEALYDLVAGAGGSLDGHAGGGPFNVARPIGRLRRPVAFLGRLSTDRLGATHARMLAEDRVGLECVMRSPDPTTLALAGLDDDGVASYGFYTAGTAAAGLTPEDALAALPERVTALHVGTLGLVLEPLARAMEAVVERLAGSTMVMVDPTAGRGRSTTRPPSERAWSASWGAATSSRSARRTLPGCDRTFPHSPPRAPSSTTARPPSCSRAGPTARQS